MPRLPSIDIDSASADVKPVLEQVQHQFGAIPNMIKLMANSGATLKGFLDLNAATSRSRLGARVRESVALRVSEHNGCTYCLSAHAALAGAAGLRREQIDEARHGHSSDPKSQAVLAFTGAVLRTRGGVSQDELDAAKRAGLSDAELTEVIAIIAHATFTNYFNRAFDTVVDYPRIDAHSHH